MAIAIIPLQLGDQTKILEDLKNGLGNTQAQLKDSQKQVY